MDDKEVIKEILQTVLIPSICKLYKEDFSNIRFCVSERNICARLAHHMENIMRECVIEKESSLFIGYYVDVEYNRMDNGHLKYFEDRQKIPRYMVSDLLIQSRKHERNLLAVELKKKHASKKAMVKDQERLASLVTSTAFSHLTECVHDTLLGAFIVYFEEGVDMELFEFSSEERKIISRKYFLKCLLDNYDSTKVNGMEVFDEHQNRIACCDSSSCSGLCCISKNLKK